MRTLRVLFSANFQPANYGPLLPRSYVCHLDASSLSNKDATSLAQQTVFATPLERKLPRIRLRTRQAPSLLDQKVLISIDAWPPHSRYPEGHFVRALGKVESKEAEQESLLLEYEVPYRPFGRAILNCLPVEGESWVVPPKEDGNLIWRDREDLRDLLICSIDPPGESLRGLSSLKVICITDTFVLHQAVKISMTLCTLDRFPTETSRPVSVSLTL